MIVKNVTQVGNPIIRKKAKAVTPLGGKKTRKLVRDLVDSMRHYDLVGMAAPQIGVGARVFVTEIRETKKRRKGESDEARAFINPRILKRSKRQVAGYEGCGSVIYGELFGKVKRPHGVLIEAYDENGKKFKLSATGLLARVIQHEFDHLNGILFLDRMSDMKTLMSREEYLKME